MPLSEPELSARQASGDASPARPPASWLRLALGVAMVLLLVTFGRELAGSVPRFTEWVDGMGVWGPVVFMIGYVVTTIAFVPGAIMTLAAGAVFVQSKLNSTSTGSNGTSGVMAKTKLCDPLLPGMSTGVSGVSVNSLVAGSVV